MTIDLIMSIAFAAFAAIMLVSLLFHKEAIMGNAPTPPIGGAALPKMRMMGGAPARALVGRKSHRPRKGNVVSRSGGMMTFVSGSRTWRLPESRLVA